MGFKGKMISKLNYVPLLLLLTVFGSGSVLAQPPGNPILVNPADGITISVPSNQAPTQIFTWNEPVSGTPPDHYYLILEDADDPATQQLSAYLPASGSTISSQQIISPALRGKTIRWTVYACTGRPPDRSCSQPVFRIINWPGGIRAPEHRRPVDGALGHQTGAADRFEWTTVSGANYYLFCAVTDENTVCPDTPVSNNEIEVVKRLGQNTFAAPDLSRWAGGTIYWKPGACDEQDNCAWNDSFRVYTLLNAPQLINPEPDGLIVPNDYRVVFTWSVVPGADGYILAVAKSGESFDKPEMSMSIEGGEKNNTVWNIPESLRRESGGRLKWTVAACVGNVVAGTGTTCNVQRNPRWISIALERPLHFRVLNGFSGRSKYILVYETEKLISPNEPVPGATVCIGTNENPSQYGVATTNGDGYVVFPYVPESHYLASALISGDPEWCNPRVGVFCPPPAVIPPGTVFVHTKLFITGGGIIGGINQPAQIRLRLNREGPGPCPVPPQTGSDTGTSIDVDTF